MAREFELEGVVPWGRGAEEYTAFFALEKLAPGARVLDCGGGPASFAAERAAAGALTVAADPLYGLPARAIEVRFAEARERMLAGVRRARHRFRWDRFGTPEGLVAVREAALRRFLEDYACASRDRAGRYVAARLPRLPFRAEAFDLALVSHLLFLYAESLDADFHREALRELLRVAREVRVFPLLDLDGRPSPHVEPARAALAAVGAESELVRVAYEFQAGGNRMLRLARPTSGVERARSSSF